MSRVMLAHATNLILIKRFFHNINIWNRLKRISESDKSLFSLKNVVATLEWIKSFFQDIIFVSCHKKDVIRCSFKRGLTIGTSYNVLLKVHFIDYRTILRLLDQMFNGFYISILRQIFVVGNKVTVRMTHNCHQIMEIPMNKKVAVKISFCYEMKTVNFFWLFPFKSTIKWVLQEKKNQIFFFKFCKYFSNNSDF